MKHKLLSFVIIGLLTTVIFIIPGCSKVENVTNSATKLIVESITGEDLEGNEGSSVIYSDVVTSTGSVFNDIAVAQLRVEPLDPLQTPTTFYQDAVIDQVDISYSRTDGLTGEGINVPYSFSQQIYARVAIGMITEVSFVIITHNAKAESPLVELINLGQEHILKLEARITFHSKDLAGNRLQPIVGGVSIWCGNFADTD